MGRRLTDDTVDLGDGRIAFVEQEYKDEAPIIRVLPREHYDRMWQVREERRELRHRLAVSAGRAKAARRERMQARLSPGAYKLWIKRHDPTYWMRKVWNSESLQKMFYDENPWLSFIEKKSNDDQSVIPIWTEQTND